MLLLINTITESRVERTGFILSYTPRSQFIIGGSQVSDLSRGGGSNHENAAY